MKRILSAALCLALAASATTAQITDGTYSDGHGYTCKVEVSDTNGSAPGVDVTVVDAGGSRTTTGVTATGSTQDKPKAKSFPEGTTTRGSVVVKGDGGKVKKKNAAGDWITLTKVETPKDPKLPVVPEVQPATSGPDSLTHASPQSGGSLPGGPQKL